MARRPPVALLAVLAAAAVAVVAAAAAQTQPPPSGEYTAEMKAAARAVVADAISKDRGFGAALIRLLFHECWVQGCDGSALVGERTPEESANATGVEKNAFSNIGLGGFDVVDEIKSKLPEVSCADIVVFAAREATIILSNGKITYDVKAGRKDGVSSSAREADRTLPSPTFNFELLKGNFAGKGFDQTELVVLSGAHAVGKAHYVSFESDRLNPTNSTPIDPLYQKELNRRRRGVLGGLFGGRTTELNNIRDMEATSQKLAGYNNAGVNTTAIGVLDNSFYANNLQNMVLFTSDWELRNDTAGNGRAGNDMAIYRDNAAKWNLDFGAAMAKLSNLPGEGSTFKTRTDCRKIN